MSSVSDDMVNGYLLREFQSERPHRHRDNAAQAHLRGCDEARLVAPVFIDSNSGCGCGDSPLRPRLDVKAAVRCPHGRNTSWSWHYGDTYAELVEEVAADDERRNRAVRKEAARLAARAAAVPGVRFVTRNTITYRSTINGSEEPAGPNTVVSDIPAVSLPWLVEQGEIVGMCPGRAPLDDEPCGECVWCVWARYLPERVKPSVGPVRSLPKPSRRRR